MQGLEEPCCHQQILIPRASEDGKTGQCDLTLTVVMDSPP